MTPTATGINGYEANTAARHPAPPPMGAARSSLLEEPVHLPLGLGEGVGGLLLAEQGRLELRVDRLLDLRVLGLGPGADQPVEVLELGPENLRRERVLLLEVVEDLRVGPGAGEVVERRAEGGGPLLAGHQLDELPRELRVP